MKAVAAVALPLVTASGVPVKSTSTVQVRASAVVPESRAALPFRCAILLKGARTEPGSALASATL